MIKEVVLYLDTCSSNVMVSAQLKKLLPWQLLHINVLHLSQFSYFYIKSTATEAEVLMLASPRHSLQSTKLQFIYLLQLIYRCEQPALFHPVCSRMKAESFPKRKSSGLPGCRLASRTLSMLSFDQFSCIFEGAFPLNFTSLDWLHGISRLC